MCTVFALNSDATGAPSSGSDFGLLFFFFDDNRPGLAKVFAPEDVYIGDDRGSLPPTSPPPVVRTLSFSSTRTQTGLLSRFYVFAFLPANVRSPPTVGLPGGGGRGWKDPLVNKQATTDASTFQRTFPRAAACHYIVE